MRNNVLLVKFRMTAVEPLIKALANAKKSGRHNVAELLGKIGNAAALPGELLHTEELSLRDRISALCALHSQKAQYYHDDRYYSYDMPDVRRFCEQMYDDTDDRIRLAAREMLAYLDDTLNVPTVRGDAATERG